MSATNRGSKAMRKSRWHKDKNGRYHYAGVCPFNNTVCRLMNYFVARRAEEAEK